VRLTAYYISGKAEIHAWLHGADKRGLVLRGEGLARPLQAHCGVRIQPIERARTLNDIYNVIGIALSSQTHRGPDVGLVRPT